MKKDKKEQTTCNELEEEEKIKQKCVQKKLT